MERQNNNFIFHENLEKHIPFIHSTLHKRPIVQTFALCNQNK